VVGGHSPYHWATMAASVINFFLLDLFAEVNVKVKICLGDGTQNGGIMSEGLAYSKESLSILAAKKRAPYDVRSVTNGCLFLKYCAENAGSLNDVQRAAESNLFAWLSFKGDDEIDEAECGLDELKEFSHALRESDGPYLCRYIDKIFPDCASCEHYRKVNSPVLIKGADFIETEPDGFYFLIYNKDSVLVRRLPDYQGIMQRFERDHKFISINESGGIFTFNGYHWEMHPKNWIKAYAEKTFNPPPDKDIQAEEFFRKLQRNNGRSVSFFNETTYRKMNFQNGVLDLKTMELHPHSPDFGFLGVLPYDYDPDATAPIFERFLLDITCERLDLYETILEFFGYAVSNDDCWLQKCIILHGDGRNGKSTLIDMLQATLGEDLNCSNMGLQYLAEPKYRAELQGKLVNFSRETSIDALDKSEDFKSIVAGEPITVRKMYCDPHQTKIRAKLVMLSNEIPRSRDKTTGLYRRLIIVPFDAVFEGDDDDKFLKDKMMKELPGILNLFLNAYKRLYQRKEICESATCDAKKQEFLFENDNVIQYFNEKLIYEPTNHEYSVFKDRLYEDYRDWTKRMGNKPANNVNFFKRLKRVAPGIQEDRLRIEGCQKRRITGIKMREGLTV